MNCKWCNSTNLQKDGNHNGYQRYKCKDCNKRFDGEINNEENSYIYHFNIKLKKTDRNKLTRDNYCLPTKELDYRTKQRIKSAKKFFEIHNRLPLMCPSYYYGFPNEVFEDEEHYSDKFVQKHYMDCMTNFDLNIEYFKSLSFDEFNKYLLKFIRKYKFNEIKDLNLLKDKSGIYILVLDEYKQVYIGKNNRLSSQKIKQEIQNHWSKRKDFGHLIFGRVETSILSIDSFGALDTTRIFYKDLKWYQDVDEFEEKMVNDFKKEYRLNRVAGGINGEDDSAIRNLKLLSTRQERELK